MAAVIAVIDSLPIHLPILFFLPSLFAGTVMIFLTAALGMAGGPGRYVMRVRPATALVEWKIRRQMIRSLPILGGGRECSLDSTKWSPGKAFPDYASFHLGDLL